MDFMRVFDPMVREIKREVNLKVLKVPEIEQKVLDATSNEPWGPHGSDLQEIAQATKKYSECQMIMNVLWTRLSDTGANWRHVYKALAVIEYLVANGSDRAVDDILEHSYKILSISGFEYVEPNGKDVGLNVRKKVENISSLLKNKDKVQEVRNKAAANRDKYFGLSSTGITYKSNTALSGGGYDYDCYGSSSHGKDEDTYKADDVGNGKYNKKTSFRKSRDIGYNDSKGNKSIKAPSLSSMDRDSLVSKGSKQSTIPELISSKSSKLEQVADDFDDFDPRGSSAKGSTHASNDQVDLFSQNLIGDLLDAPVSTSSTLNITSSTTEVDLFADTAFVSVKPHSEATSASAAQENIDLFNSHQAPFTAFPPNLDLFGASDSPLPPQTKSPQFSDTNPDSFDPFASVPLNNFDTQDSFGDLTSHAVSVSPESVSHPEAPADNVSKPAAKKDGFQVKSSIWADSLSRGLIDLNITAPKKVSLADIGVVGALDDGDKGRNAGTAGGFVGLGQSGFSTASGIGGGGNFYNSQWQPGGHN